MKEIKTAEEALEAVKQNGWALRHVQIQYQTEEVCRAAAEKSPGAIGHIRDPEMFLKILAELK